nr:hypothetical protein CFP56_69344 [Quercus suber]
MLALMPQSPALPSLHAPSPRSSSATMSLAILPSSPMSYAQPPPPPPPVALSSQLPSPSKRPKLSLNTVNAVPIFGKKSTSLRLETLSATSPTAVNTFTNGHDAERSLKDPVGGRPRPRPRRPSLALSITPAPMPSEPTEDRPASTTRSSAVSPTSSASSTDSFPRKHPPYRLAYNTDSILKNGPYPHTRGKRRTAFALPRAIFPTPKTVSFRACLTEDICTFTYTWKNSDLSGPSSPTLHALSTREEGEAMKAAHGGATIIQPQTGEKRESSDEEEEEEEQGEEEEQQQQQDHDDAEICPQTPVAGRRKRTRQWRWTLGPITPDYAAADVDVEPGDVCPGKGRA